jgi:hypothetical protein
MRTHLAQNGTGLRGLLLAVVLSLSFLAIFGMGGCSTSPVEPPSVDTGLNESISAVQTLDSLAAAESFDQQGPVAQRILGLLQLTSASDRQPISNDGCTLRLVFGSDTARFVVPAGAVNRQKFPNAKYIEIRGFRLRTPLGDTYLYDCGPDGLKFVIPIQLQQPMNSKRLVARLLYFNELRDVWELIDLSPIENGQTDFEIEHFSKYGVS